MDDDQKELLKISAEAAMKPFSELALNLFGPVTTELGKSWGEWAKRRSARAGMLDGFYRARVRDAGINPELVPDYIAIPLLEAAMLTDDEILQDTWANMMANAADPRQSRPVRALFPEMLRGLSALE